MKECPNCGKKLNEEDTFCSNCGFDFNKQNDDNLEQDAFIKNAPHAPKKFVSQIHYGPKLFDDDNKDFILLDEYIGNNAHKMKNGFSWPAFFLSTLYLFYRKMWGLGFISVIVYFIAIKLINNDIILLAVLFVFNLILGIIFKDTYLNKGLRTVEYVQEKYKDNTDEEMAEIVRKEGRTSELAFIVSFIALVVLLVFTWQSVLTTFKNVGTTIYDLVKDRIDESKESARKIEDIVDEKNKTNIIGKFYMSLPNDFTAHEGNTVKSATYENKNGCKITATMTEAATFGNTTTYLDLKVKQTTVNSNLEYKDIKLQKYDWVMVKSTETVPKFITYVSVYERYLYDITFQTESENDTACLLGSEVISNTFKFKKGNY